MGRAPRFAAEMARVAQLRAARDEAEDAWRRHCQHCPRCGRAGLLSRDTCEDGWQVALRRAKARRGWADRDRITAPGRAPSQGTLF